MHACKQASLHARNRARLRERVLGAHAALTAGIAGLDGSAPHDGAVRAPSRRAGPAHQSNRCLDLQKSRSSSPLPPDPSAQRALLRYLIALYGRVPGSFTEIRFRDPDDPDRWRQRYYPVAQPAKAAGAIIDVGNQTDTYIGVAARRRRAGDKSAIDELHVVWADLDGPAKIDAEGMPVPPGVVVRSGTDEHRHLYWLLSEPVEVDQAENANRRLAGLLAADGGAVCNAAALLRPPSTLSFKGSPPTAVVLERLSPARHQIDEVLAGVPELRRSNAPHPPCGGRGGESADALLRIEPAVYAAVLTGRVAGRDRKIHCPFHDDRVPSLHLYPTGEEGWFCFGACSRGGDVYDFGSRLWGLRTSGRTFVELRARLAQRLLP
jgi:hypothetical protein